MTSCYLKVFPSAKQTPQPHAAACNHTILCNAPSANVRWTAVVILSILYVCVYSVSVQDTKGLLQYAGCCKMTCLQSTSWVLSISRLDLSAFFVLVRQQAKAASSSAVKVVRLLICVMHPCVTYLGRGFADICYFYTLLCRWALMAVP